MTIALSMTTQCRYIRSEEPLNISINVYYHRFATQSIPTYWAYMSNAHYNEIKSAHSNILWMPYVSKKQPHINAGKYQFWRHDEIIDVKWKSLTRSSSRGQWLLLAYFAETKTRLHQTIECESCDAKHLRLFKSLKSKCNIPALNRNQKRASRINRNGLASISWNSYNA